MAKGKTLCNVCGQPFTDFDENAHIGLHTRIGYGSKHDGETIDVDICCSCLDKLMDKYSDKCAINPIHEKY